VTEAETEAPRAAAAVIAVEMIAAGDDSGNGSGGSETRPSFS
jgi:hypothetical protein